MSILAPGGGPGGSGLSAERARAVRFRYHPDWRVLAVLGELGDPARLRVHLMLCARWGDLTVDLSRVSILSEAALDALIAARREAPSTGRRHSITIVARQGSPAALAFAGAGSPVQEPAAGVAALFWGGSPPVAAAMPSEREEWPGRHAGLTRRESEVVAGIVAGLGNEVIAEMTFLGVNTVKTYIRTAYQKMGVNTRTRALLWALDHGFDRPDRQETTLSGNADATSQGFV